MKFLVTRTSIYDYDSPPCEECNKEIRLFKICGKEEYRGCFTIEINSLEELISFEEKYGKIVIQDNEYFNMKEIEIYDYWRE